MVRSACAASSASVATLPDMNTVLILPTPVYRYWKFLTSFFEKLLLAIIAVLFKENRGILWQSLSQEA